MRGWPHSSTFVGVTVAAIVASGCLSAPASTPSDTPPSADPASLVAFVHAAVGPPDPNLTFLGDLPRFVQVNVSILPTSEPTIAISKSGAAFYPVWLGLFQVPDLPNDPPPRSLVFRTQDDGATWRDVTPKAATVPVPPWQGDPYVYADHATGRVFSVFNYLGCNYIIFTDDDGATWTHSPVACGQPITDHETLFSAPPTTANPLGSKSVLYQCFNQILKATCSRSFDGGLTWVPGGDAYRQDDARVNCGDTMAHGHGAGSPKDGTVYLPRGACGKTWVSVSRDQGLTWTVRLVDGTRGVDGHEGRVAVDRAGNVYYLFVDRARSVQLAISRDHGATWSPPFNVTRPGLGTARYPAIIAGDEGRVAWSYVATNRTGACSATAEAGIEWSQFVGLTLDATSANPTIATTSVNDRRDPVARGACSRASMGDFVGMDWDPRTGRIWTALVDSCHDDCVNGTTLSQRYKSARSAAGLMVGGAGLLEAT